MNDEYRSKKKAYDDDSALGPPLEEIRRAAHAIVDEVLETFERVGSREPIRGLDDDTSSRLRSMKPTRDGRPLDEVIQTLFNDVYSSIAHTNHPRFFAFIPSPVSPISWLGDIALSLGAVAGAQEARDSGAIARF